MNIDISVITESLTESTISSYSYIKSEHRPIKIVLPFDIDYIHSEGVLYIATANDLIHSNVRDRFPQGSDACFICICLGEIPSSIYESMNCDIVFIEESKSRYDVLEEVQRIIVMFLDWEQSLNQIIENYHDVSDLLRSAASVLQGDLWVMDESGSVMVYGTFYQGRMICDTRSQAFSAMIASGHEQLAFNARKTIMADAGRNSEFTDFSIYESKNETDDETNALVCLTKVADNHYLLVGLFASQRNSSARNRMLLPILASHIGFTFTYYGLMPKVSDESDPIIFLKRILDGGQASSLSLAQCMMALRWDYNSDEYLCCCIGINDESLDAPSKSRIQRQIRGTIMVTFNSRVFLYGESMVAIINLTKSNMSEDECSDRLCKFAKQDCFVCGISSSRKSLHRLADRYKQAHIAFCCGQRQEWMVPAYRFSSGILEYAVDCITAAMPPEAFCPKQIMQLIKHDKDYGTSYFITLKTYMENGCSATAASKLLFVGRSSFLYRISKIESFTGFDLKSSETKLLILLCFKIIDDYGLENLKLETFESIDF